MSEKDIWKRIIKKISPLFRLNSWRQAIASIQLIPQSHRPHWHETDIKPTEIIKFGERSVYNRFVGLVPVYVRPDTNSGRDLSNIFERFFFWKIVCCLSVWCRCCRGAFGVVSVLIWLSMVDDLSVLYPSHTGQTDTKPTKIAKFSMNRPAVGHRQCCWRHRKTGRVHFGVISGKIRYGIARFETDR